MNILEKLLKNKWEQNKIRLIKSDQSWWKKSLKSESISWNLHKQMQAVIHKFETSNLPFGDFVIFLVAFSEYRTLRMNIQSEIQILTTLDYSCEDFCKILAHITEMSFCRKTVVLVGFWATFEGSFLCFWGQIKKDFFKNIVAFKLKIQINWS